MPGLSFHWHGLAAGGTPMVVEEWWGNSMGNIAGNQEPDLDGGWWQGKVFVGDE